MAKKNAKPSHIDLQVHESPKDQIGLSFKQIKVLFTGAASSPAAGSGAAAVRQNRAEAASASEAAFAALLQQLGVAAYVAALAEESVRSADDLRELTADDLKELGFKMGARTRVLKWSAQ